MPLADLKRGISRTEAVGAEDAVHVRVARERVRVHQGVEAHGGAQVAEDDKVTVI